MSAVVLDTKSVNQAQNLFIVFKFQWTHIDFVTTVDV